MEHNVTTVARLRQRVARSGHGHKGRRARSDACHWCRVRHGCCADGRSGHKGRGARSQAHGGSRVSDRSWCCAHRWQTGGVRNLRRWCSDHGRLRSGDCSSCGIRWCTVSCERHCQRGNDQATESTNLNKSLSKPRGTVPQHRHQPFPYATCILRVVAKTGAPFQ